MKKPQQLEWTDGKAILDANGSEIVDPRPVSLPLGFERPESIQETIRRLVTDPRIRAELSGTDIESFDDADDFEMDEDLPVHTPYEDNFDPLHLATREQEIRAGAVRDRTLEEKKAADALLKKREAEILASKAPPAPKV